MNLISYMTSAGMRIQVMKYAWMFIAVTMMVGCIVSTHEMIKSEYSSMFHGEITLNAIVFGIALGCFFAALNLAKDKRWARRSIKAVSWLVVVYTITYVLFGGYDDTGWVYALCVLSALTVSIFSLRVLRNNS